MLLSLLSRFFSALPLGAAMALATALGRLWFYALPIRRRVAEDQVARALGPGLPAKARRRIVRQSFENTVKWVVEALRSPTWTEAASKKLVARQNFHIVDGMLARGRGVIAVTIHLGNFELLGTSQTLRGYPIDAILKDIHWPSAQRFWAAHRKRTGLGHIPARKSWAQIERSLGQNRIVAFLIDQHMAPYRSIVCSFFNRLAATTTAPVRMAQATGAPILPLLIVRTGAPGHHQITMLPEFALTHPHGDPDLDLHHNVQRLNDLVEAWVRAYPEQWLWAHRRWKVSDRPGPGAPAHHPTA